MNIHQAILAAANQIELHPETYNFSSIYTPGYSGAPAGCALGWISAFCENPDTCGREYFRAALPDLGLTSPSEFYARMDSCLWRKWSFLLSSPDEWREDAKICAATLRRYAVKFHPIRKRTGIPQQIRDIFKIKEHCAETRGVQLHSEDRRSRTTQS